MPHSRTILTGVGPTPPPFFVCRAPPVTRYTHGMAYPYHSPKPILTSVAAATSSVVLAAASGNNRKGISVFNDSTATLYLAKGDSASTTLYTVQIAPGGFYECPYGYSGPLSGIWSAVNGSAKITEVF